MEMYLQVSSWVGIASTRRKNPPKPEDAGRFVRVYSIIEAATKDGTMQIFDGCFVDANGENIPDGWVRVYEHEVDVADGIVLFTKDLL